MIYVINLIILDFNDTLSVEAPRGDDIVIGEATGSSRSQCVLVCKATTYTC